MGSSDYLPFSGFRNAFLRTHCGCAAVRAESITEYYIMKPKTFTYNQIIQFFNENHMPLNEKQIKLIASKVRFEFEKLEDYRKKREGAKQAAISRRELKKKNPERIARLEKFKNPFVAPEK